MGGSGKRLAGTTDSATVVSVANTIVTA